ncbi:MAG TPA: STAS domain-containing protein [Planctomycetota bacterium]|nr:STAS domain-containing protein [Planctomycetota bacterium]
MQTILRRIDRVGLYGLHGDLDATLARPFLAEVDRVLDQGVTTLVIDARAIGFLSSKGLRALVEARRRCRERGGELAITRPSRAVRQLLELLELRDLLPIYTSEGAACAAEA